MSKNKKEKKTTEKSKPKSSPPQKRGKKKAHFREALRQLFQENRQKGFSINQMFRLLGLRSRADKNRMVEDLEALAQTGQVFMTDEGYFQGKDQAPAALYEGVVDFVNPRFAFVVCEGLESDVWVNVDDLKFALDGDRVKVKVFPQRAGKKPEGEVVEILHRAKDEFVGKIELSERYAFVVADNKKMHLDIFVPNNAINEARHGDKVIVKIVEWHTEKNSPVGVVKQVLGQAGTHETEMHAILAEFGLPTTFPPEVEEEAKRIRSRVTEAEIKKRRDFRPITTFTIDPVDAKDFDDALSIRKLENGHWEIGIHIADVTHYVRPGTALEEEAYQRATSVYLVDRVVPMLPEKLSNDLCSLRPHEDRLTFSAVFELDDEAQVHHQWFGRTVIYSDRRFAYEEAQEVLESGQGDFAQELLTLNRLAKTLTKRRFQAGAINFETQEVRFKLDENGRPIDIYIKERRDAHRLIEEFMLLANRYVAEFIYTMREGKKNDQEKTMVYRIHEEPDAEKLKNFSVFARKFGHDVALSGKAISTTLNRLVSRTTGTPQQDVLQYLAIRTMAKARYSTEAIGHFGLAFDHYTHFTSPIRRYPDMMVHRLLQRYLEQKSSINREECEAQCKHATDMEKRAADAERASIKYKQVEFMQLQKDQHKVYLGVVTGVTEWGVYVEITETKCEGMVRMSDMLDDFYELDADNYRLIGKKHGRMIVFGDTVRVKIKDTNLEKRTMDLQLVEH